MLLSEAASRGLAADCGRGVVGCEVSDLGSDHTGESIPGIQMEIFNYKVALIRGQILYCIHNLYTLGLAKDVLCLCTKQAM